MSNRAKKSKVSFNIWSLANSKSFRHSQPYTQRFYHYIQANKISQLVWNRCKREWRNDSLTKLSSRSSKNSSPTSQRKKPTKSNDLKKIANKNRMKIDQQRKDTQAVTRSRRCTLEYPSHCAAHSVWTEFPLETPNPDRKPSKKRDLMSRLDWYAICFILIRLFQGVKNLLRKTLFCIKLYTWTTIDPSNVAVYPFRLLSILGSNIGVSTLVIFRSF